MTTLLTEPDERPLRLLPSWMPGSPRAAGAGRALWNALWDALALSYLPAWNAVIDFSANDPAGWTGPDEAEGDFLALWPPTLSALRSTLSGPETDAARLERLLTLRTLIAAPYPQSERTIGWALTAALGLAARGQYTAATLPAGAFAPSLESYADLTVTLDATDPATLPWRVALGDASLMVASRPLWRRRPRPGSPPAAYSPWGRAQAMPLLDPALHPRGDGEEATSAHDDVARGEVTLTSPTRRYDGSGPPGGAVRPGLLAPDAPLEALTSAVPVVARTTADAMRYGDADLRVPGGSLPSPRWRQAVPPVFAPTWGTGPRRDDSVIAPPFDLDTDLSQPAPSASPVYGAGPAVPGLPEGHPLTPEYV